MRTFDSRNMSVEHLSLRWCWKLMIIFFRFFKSMFEWKDLLSISLYLYLFFRFLHGFCGSDLAPRSSHRHFHRRHSFSEYPFSSIRTMHHRNRLWLRLTSGSKQTDTLVRKWNCKPMGLKETAHRLPVAAIYWGRGLKSLVDPRNFWQPKNCHTLGRTAYFRSGNSLSKLFGLEKCWRRNRSIS